MLNPRPVELDSPLNRRVRVFLGIGPAAPEWAEPFNLWVTQVCRRIGWTPPANPHLTLRFFGSITQGDVLKITEIVSKIGRKHSSFKMEAVDLALFPDANRPRVAAVKLRDESGELIQLEENIRKQTADFGQRPEERDFTPHVTFGRIRENDRRAQKLVGDLWMENALPELPEWPVNEMTLFKSDLQPSGSVYTPLAKFPFGRQGVTS
jgi:2'-5' RNA ligase